MNIKECLLNEAKSRMKKLYEYSFYRNGVFEDGDGNDTNPQPSPESDMNGQDMPDTNGNQPMPQNSADNGIGEQSDDVDGANLAPNAGMNDTNDNVGGVMNNGAEDSMMGDMDTQPGVDDDVVDITELTDSQDEISATQDEMADQMSDVDQKLVTLMKVVDKFVQTLDAQDNKINDLKKELIKRNPTEEETMNVRLNAGGNPFGQKPEEFWEKFKDINNHYNITTNNKAPQYQIRKSDIDNFNDKMVSDGVDDIPSSLMEYFDR